MKVAVVVAALISSAIAMSYGTVQNQPATYDRLDDGYPNPEKLVSIDNFGVGIAVPHRKTKFSPVRYVHPHNPNGGNPHGGNPHGGNPHGGNPHGGIPQGGNVHPITGGQGFNVHAFNNGRGRFNQQFFGHPPSGTGSRRVGYGTQGQTFSRDPRGFFPAAPGKRFDGQLHRVSKPTLPTTGHDINTDNVHIGVPLASRPVHSQLKGFPSHAPIHRIPLRNIDLGAHATDFKSNTKQSFDGLNVHIGTFPNILKENVHKTPLQFPVVPIEKKDSFKGDNFFNGNTRNIGAPNVGYGGGNAVVGGKQRVY